MADYTYDGGSYAPASHRVGKQVSMTNLAGAAASLALIVGVGVWGYGVMARDVSGVPVVQAATGPMRIAPEDPGGTLADHQGLAVNAVAGMGSAEGPAEQLMLAPVPAGLAAEDVASNAMEPVAQSVPVALTQDANTVQLLPDQSEEDAVLALVAQLAAEAEPLEPLAQDMAASDLTDLQDVSSSGSDLLDDPMDGSDLLDGIEGEDLAEAEPAYTGPGLARSLRPKLRPGGMQVASMGPVDAAVVAAATAPVTRELDAATLPAGTRLVQIGAFDSPETARTEWQRLEGRFGEFLEGKGRVIQQAQSGGRTFYRLRAEGFVDLADARRFCAAFVAEKVDCIPVVTK